MDMNLLINNTLKRIRRINVDLDGVLADFDGRYTEITGESWNRSAESNEDKWSKIAQHPNFFLDLPWVPGSREMWELLKPYRPCILSAASSHILQSKEQKKTWCKRELSLEGPERVIIVDHQKEKQLYVLPGDILIDDNRLTIDQWNGAGGIGIHFINAVDAMAKLKEILYGQQSRMFLA